MQKANRHILRKYLKWFGKLVAVHLNDISSLDEALISGNVGGNALILPSESLEQLMN